MKGKKCYDKSEALRDYPGASIDSADGCKATARLEKQETTILNNNPRNTDENTAGRP